MRLSLGSYFGRSSYLANNDNKPLATTREQPIVCRRYFVGAKLPLSTPKDSYFLGYGAIIVNKLGVIRMCHLAANICIP